MCAVRKECCTSEDCRDITTLTPSGSGTLSSCARVSNLVQTEFGASFALRKPHAIAAELATGMQNEARAHDKTQL
jgi:hypothetical protein